MSSVLGKLQELNLDSLAELLQEKRIQYGLLAGLFGAFMLYKLLRKRKYNLPSGPRGWPLVGNMFSLSSASKMNKNFKKWRKQYGDIFTVYVGPKPVIVLATPDVIKEAFINKGHDFDGRIEMPSFDCFSEGGKDIAFAQPGPVWKLQRQIAHAAIRKHATGQNLERNLESAMENFFKSVCSQKDGIVDIPNEMLRLTYNFLASTCFGREFDLDDPWLNNFQKMVNEYGELVGSGFISDFIPALRMFERSRLNRLTEVADEFLKLINTEMDEHEKTFDPTNTRDLTDEILLQLEKQKENPEANPVLAQLERAHLRQVISDVFGAGTDTSRMTLAMIIGYLVQYPNVQAKLHKELDDVLGESRKVTLKTKEMLPFTNAVVHEVMRIEPVVPIGVPHRTTNDTVLGEFSIPKGTLVLAHTYGVHRDPENFNNPEEFRPERWIDENGKFQYKPYKFIPFSMGPRVCVGEALARADLHMCTAMIFQKYEFQTVDGKPFKVQVTDFPIGVETLPFKMKLKERY